MTNYVHDEKNNRIEALSKEEIYALIDEVIATGELPSDVPPAFVTALKSIVDGNAYKIGFCTQAEYNELEEEGLLEENGYYFITDDETEQDLEDAIATINTTLEWVVEHINAGIKNNITNINCAFDFSTWENWTSSYLSGNQMYNLDLTSTNDNQVNIFPAGSNASIAEVTIEQISGDSGYIGYTLNPINTSLSYIAFTAKNISSGSIYGLGNTGYITKSATFRITVKDVYNTVFTKEFTVSFKVPSQEAQTMAYINGKKVITVVKKGGQLYKHSVKLQGTYQSAPFTIYAEIISNDATNWATAGFSWTDIDDLAANGWSGFIAGRGGQGDNLYQYMNCNSQQIANLYTDYETPTVNYDTIDASVLEFITDTVTPIN